MKISKKAASRPPFYFTSRYQSAGPPEFRYYGRTCSEWARPACDDAIVPAAMAAVACLIKAGVGYTPVPRFYCDVLPEGDMFDNLMYKAIAPRFDLFTIAAIPGALRVAEWHGIAGKPWRVSFV